MMPAARTILLLPVLLVAASAYASRTDSLIAALGKLPDDRSRLPVLRELFRAQVMRAPDSALQWAAGYARLARGTEDPAIESLSHSQFGHAWLVKGHHARALPYFLRALPAQERTGNDEDLGFLLGNIGEIHKQQRNWSAARAAFLRSHTAFARAGSVMWMAGSSQSLAEVYQALGMSDSAEVWYARAVDVMEQVGAGDHAQEARMGRAGILLERGEEEKALDLYRQAMHLKSNSNDDLVKCMGFIAMGRLLTRLERYAEADTVLMHALRIAAASGFDTERSDAHLAHSELLAAAGDPQGALDALRTHLAWKDSLFNQRNSALIAEAQERFESGRKDAELARQQAQLQRRSLVLYTLIAIGALGLMAGIVLYRAYRQRKRMAETLAQQNAVVEHALGQKELLLRELHHRVKNNMQTVGSLLRLQSRSAPDAATREALNEALMRVKSLSLVHQGLYRDDALTTVRMDDYLGRIAEGLVRSHGMEQRVLLSLDLAPAKLDVDSAVPLGLVLNELLTNALKHAFPAERSGTIHVVLHDKEELLVLEVADDGIGYAPEENGAATATLVSGSAIVATFAEALRAEWSVTQDQGTTVRFAARNFSRA
ncbi:MAG: tetratricopeptide repeat protein [Flavobacteriales bacterium]|nr:tetratricopeptide repeat protein [Flavobacteriales bacterium]